MKYPEGFIAKVREAFPDHGDIEQCLQNGSDILGRILDDNQVRFSPGQIIHAFETGQTAELLEEARKGQQIWDLYREWGALRVREISVRQRR